MKAVIGTGCLAICKAGHYLQATGHVVNLYLKEGDAVSFDDLIVISGNNVSEENMAIMLSFFATRALDDVIVAADNMRLSAGKPHADGNEPSAGNEGVAALTREGSFIKTNLHLPLADSLRRAGCSPEQADRHKHLPGILAVLGADLLDPRLTIDTTDQQRITVHKPSGTVMMKNGSHFFGDYIAALSGKTSVLLNERMVQKYLGFNEYEGQTYFIKENFDQFLQWHLSLFYIENYDLTTERLREGTKTSHEKRGAKRHAIDSKRAQMMTLAAASYLHLTDIVRNTGYKAEGLTAFGKAPENK